MEQRLTTSRGKTYEKKIGKGGLQLLLLYSIALPNSVVLLLLLHEILDNMGIVIICYLGCDVINFETNLIFLIKPFFLNDQKVKTKI